MSQQLHQSIKFALAFECVFLVTEEENNVTIDMFHRVLLQSVLFIYLFFSLKKHIKWIFWLMYEQVSRLCETFVHFSWNLEHVVY